LIVPSLKRVPKRVALLLGLVGALLLVLGATRIESTDPYPGAAALIPVIGTSLLLAAGTATTAGVTRLLGVRPANWLGDLSYSWYLWHWPAIVFARAMWPATGLELVLVCGASLVPAWLSYRYVENRFRADSRYVGRRAVALVAVCVAIPLVASLGLWFSARMALRTDALQSAGRDVIPLHADVTRGCDLTGLGAALPSGCTFRAPHSRGAVVLIGDSQAGQLTEPAAHAANRIGLDLTVATEAACPFADLIVEKLGQPDKECRRSMTHSLSELVRTRPRLVILASAIRGYVYGDAYGLVDSTNDSRAASPVGKSLLFEAGLEKTLRVLHRAGIPAVIVHAIPHFEGFDPQRCAALRLYVDASDCDATLSKKHLRDQRRLALAAESEAIESVPGVTGVDLAQNICGRGDCRARRGDLWMYRDGSHLSVNGSLTLTDRLADLVAEHARHSP
jgi:hypothetical protein